MQLDWRKCRWSNYDRFWKPVLRYLSTVKSKLVDHDATSVFFENKLSSKYPNVAIYKQKLLQWYLSKNVCWFEKYDVQSNWAKPVLLCLDTHVKPHVIDSSAILLNQSNVTRMEYAVHLMMMAWSTYIRDAELRTIQNALPVYISLHWLEIDVRDFSYPWTRMCFPVSMNVIFYILPSWSTTDSWG